VQLIAVQCQHVVQLRLESGDGLLLYCFDAARELFQAFRCLVGALQRVFEQLRLGF
jgi:hypothetical protein